MLDNGERQVAPELSGIRRDHRTRYHWAARNLPAKSRVLDFACGVGYGSSILAEAGHKVVGVDRSREAIDYGRRHYAHQNARLIAESADWLRGYAADSFDAVTCFETVEHLEDPLPVLKDISRLAPVLLASVPNETFFPFRNYRFHHRHYTEAQFLELLDQAGFAPVEILGQAGPQSEVGRKHGRTLIVMAKRKEITAAKVPAGMRDSQMAGGDARPPRKPIVPERVAILGLGLSLRTYVNAVKALGAREKLCDEVWGINALGDLFQCDRLFHQDDVRIQELRAAADPTSNIAAMLPWLKRHPGPIYTSQPHPDYPGMVAYPLAAVLNSCAGQRYLNSTAACAIAFAIHLGVKKIMCFGMDFTLPDAHHAEQGRACVEFWLGFARARGIDILVPKESSLLDAAVPNDQRIYGYDAVDLAISGPPGKERVAMTPRKVLPTAEEIERRYDHSRHPNPLMRD